MWGATSLRRGVGLAAGLVRPACTAVGMPWDDVSKTVRSGCSTSGSQDYLADAGGLLRAWKLAGDPAPSKGLPRAQGRLAGELCREPLPGGAVPHALGMAHPPSLSNSGGRFMTCHQLTCAIIWRGGRLALKPRVTWRRNHQPVPERLHVALSTQQGCGVKSQESNFLKSRPRFIV